MLSQAIINTFKKCNGGLKYSQKGWWWPIGSFHNYTNKLFSGKSILRIVAAPLLFLFVIRSSLAALFALFPA